MLEVSIQKDAWFDRLRENSFIYYINNMVFKKWNKAASKKKKIEVTAEDFKKTVKALEEETPVSTVVENEITDDEIPAWTVIAEEQPVFIKRKISNKIWEIWWSAVSKPKGRIRFEAQVAPFPMFKLPDDIRRWLVNNWYSSDVYKKDKEWMEKHHVDMKMVEKLKEFLTEQL